MNPTKKLPLFIVTGASGVGKSTLCERLFQTERGYIVMESDLLWNDAYDTPADGYRNYREIWMRLCRHISQIGMPVVLCGCGIPEQFERCGERKYFTGVHYLAAVCDGAVLERRLREGRGVTDESRIKSSLEFNEWLKNNAADTEPPIRLLDTTGLDPARAAAAVDQWILEKRRRPSE